jgi:hypothetical protein
MVKFYVQHIPFNSFGANSKSCSAVGFKVPDNNKKMTFVQSGASKPQIRTLRLIVVVMMMMPGKL